MTKNKVPWAEVKHALRQLPSNELIGLVKDLYDRSPENRSFIEARLSVGDDMLTDFKKRIEDGLYPDPMKGLPISITAAKKAVSDYARAKGDPRGMLDLMLYYVECGTELTLDQGDMDERYYSSLESMFDRALTQLQASSPELRDLFLPRAVRVVERSDGIGWGYHDYLVDRLYAAFPDLE